MQIFLLAVAQSGCGVTYPKDPLAARDNGGDIEVIWGNADGNTYKVSLLSLFEAL